MDLKSRAGRREQGELIKVAAAAAGLTLKELAVRLGVSHALIYQYVSGVNLAQPDKLQEISQLTGQPVAYFFGESPSLPIAATASETSSELPLVALLPAASIGIDTPPPSGTPQVDSLRLQQNIRQLDTLAQAQDRLGRDLTGLLATLEQMLGLVRLGNDNQRETELLLRIGNARTDAGELASARTALEECLALSLELNLEDRSLGARQSLARCCSLLGDLERAEALFREVAASPTPSRSWRGLLGVGQILEQRDKYEEALAQFEQAGEVVETLPSDENGRGARAFAELYVRTNLANVYMAEGDFATALPLWQENIHAAEQLSQPDQFLEALLSEAVCHLYLGRAGMAHECCQRVVRLCRLLEDTERLAVGLACLAEVLATAGLAEDGIRESRASLNLAGSTGSSRARSFAHLALARNLILAGQVENAAFYLEAEVTSPYRKVRAAARLIQAELARRGGAATEAVEAARSALRELGDIGAFHLERAAWVSLARAAVSVADWAAVEEAILRAEALGELTPGFADTPWQLEWAAAERLHATGDPEGALVRLLRSVEYIENLRRDMASHGLLETCLDDPEKLSVYVRAITLARETGDPATADNILERAVWPPLAEVLSENGREKL